ncbi:MAG: class I SAM-dependent methyltransferase [Burkholderiales bacterium]
MTEWQANDYHRQSSLQQAMADEQLSRLTLEGGERILDVGCGDGKITAEIAARVPRGSVLGVDPSRDMIAFAAGHFGSPVQANLRFEVADARRLPYRNEFDLVVSFNALHWVPEQDVALRSIRAALKPGGRALLRQVSNGPRKSLEDVIEEVRHLSRWSGHFTGLRQPYVHFNPEDYRALAEQAGFQVVRLHVDDKAWDFKTREGFGAFARATFVEWTQHLPESDRDAFITDVLDRYQAVAADNPREASTFKFYQMEVELTSAP